MSKNKKIDNGDYFYFIALALDIEYRKGKIYWLYKYIILTMQMHYYLYLDRLTKHKNQMRFITKFDQRCLYKIFLKGYILDYSQFNEAW